MKTLTAALVLAVGVSVATLLPAAEDKADQKVAVILVERIQDLHLTDAQEAKIADLRKEFRPKVAEASKELTTLVKQEVEKVRAVSTPEQKQKLEAAKEERQKLRAERLSERIAHLEALDLTDDEVAKIVEIRKECRPKIVKVLEGLKGILSEDQKKAREEALKGGKKRREVLESLKLTDEQKQKVEALGKELRTLTHEELAQMRDVLSKGEKEKPQEFKEERREHVRDRMVHRIPHLKELNLTEDQRMKLAEIRKEYRPKVHEAGNKLRAIVREEMEQILAVLKK